MFIGKFSVCSCIKIIQLALFYRLKSCYTIIENSKHIKRKQTFWSKILTSDQMINKVQSFSWPAVSWDCRWGTLRDRAKVSGLRKHQRNSRSHGVLYGTVFRRKGTAPLDFSKRTWSAGKESVWRIYQILHRNKLTSWKISEMPLLTILTFQRQLDFSKAKFKYYKIEPIKQTVTMRLDADLVAVLKSFGKGYQSKTNEILRSVVMEHKMPVLDFTD